MELLIKSGSKRYFKAIKNNKEILLSVNSFDGEKTVEEIKESLNSADIAGYLKEKYSIESICNEPLGNIFDIEMYSFGNTLTPKNISLWEYETLIKRSKEVEPALKSVFICKDSEYGSFYIACEPYDGESMLTRKNVNIIEKYISSHIKTFENILNMNYSHTEIY